jgi:hypothetical protein
MDSGINVVTRSSRIPAVTRLARLRTSLALLLVSVVTATCLAQPAANSPITDQLELELRVQRLVQQLEDPNRQRRDAAEQQLTELGEAVLPLLPETTPTTPAETTERLARIRQALDRATQLSLMKPARLNITGEYSLGELFAEIERQTGNRVIDFRERFGQQPSESKLKIAIEDQSFWQALDKVLDQAGLTTYNYAGEPRTVSVVAANEQGQGTPRSARASYPGVFRVEATEIQAQRNLRAGSGYLRVRLELNWEPRLMPILVRQPYSEVQVLADDGSPIQVTSPEGAAEVPIQSTVAGIDLVLPLQLPERSVKQIASLKGRFYAVIPGREESFEFGELPTARNVSRQRGGMEVTLERVRQNGTVYEFRVRLRLLNTQDTFQSHLDWVSNNVVYLVNSRGEKIEQPNFERYLEREREVGYGYLFPVPDDLKDYQLVYRVPVSLVTVPVDYELHEIPLP